MIIESIAIENFQSHVNTVLEPAPAGQLTVIVGPSDSGKTAIIRALRWNYYDIPRGADFINVKANAARVTVAGTNGAQVTRERSRKGYNRYVANGQKYEGFGSEIPAEVLDATGVRPVTVGDLKLNLNLAEQLDGPFLGKSVSAPGRAKVLGKLAGTEEIDFAARQLGTDLYRRRLDEKTLSAGIKKLDEQIKGFDYLPALAGVIAELERVVAALKAARERRQKLTEARANLALASAGKAEAEAVIKRWAGLGEAQDRLVEAAGAGDWQRRLTRLEAVLAAIRVRILDAQYVSEKWRGLGAAAEDCAAAARASSRRAALERYRELSGQVRAAISENKKTARRLAGVNEAEAKVKQALVAGANAASIETLCQEMDLVRSAKQKAKAIIIQSENIEKAKALARSAESAASQLGRLGALGNKLRQAGAGARKSREAAVLWEQKVGELEGAYTDELIALGRCPVCGNDIDIQKLKEVV